MSQKIAIEELGNLGRMICHSKGQYNHENPRNLTVFNGNVCTKDGKIWWGDIDITEHEENLSNLSIRLNETIYVLYEHDARFANEEKPVLSKAVAKFTNGKIDLGKKTEYFTREEGKLLEKRIEQEEYTPPRLPEWEEDETKYLNSDFEKLGTIPWPQIEALQIGMPYYEVESITEDERKLQNPLNHFFNWASTELKKLNLKEGEKVSLYVRTQDSDRLVAIVKNFLINRMEMEEGSYRLKKEISSLGFVLPFEFHGSKKGPTWTEDDIAYIKR